jgi:hypothetical protein
LSVAASSALPSSALQASTWSSIRVPSGLVYARAPLVGINRRGSKDSQLRYVGDRDRRLPARPLPSQ